jgi:hypothetical protein
MSIVNEIEHLYSVLDTEYSKKEFNARKNGHTVAENSWKQKKSLKTQSH